MREFAVQHANVNVPHQVGRPRSSNAKARTVALLGVEHRDANHGSRKLNTNADNSQAAEVVTVEILVHERTILTEVLWKLLHRL